MKKQTRTSIVTPSSDTSISQQKIVDFVRELHSSLDIKSVLMCFHREIKTHMDYTNFEYISVNGQLIFQAGTKRCSHQLSYHLDLNDAPLGEVRFTREDDFSEQESCFLEEYLCFLLHPLNNAILHQDALEKAAQDPLTGLANRATLNDNLEREIHLAKRHSHNLSVIILDIDNFKNINDRYGHLMGDKVLTHLANSIRCCIRKTDLAYRIGGEEFLIILNKTQIQGAIRLADRLRKSIELADFPIESDEKVTISLGISSYIDGDNKYSLYTRADEALYRAKRQGKNTVCT